MHVLFAREDAPQCFCLSGLTLRVCDAAHGCGCKERGSSGYSVQWARHGQQPSHLTAVLLSIFHRRHEVSCRNLPRNGCTHPAYHTWGLQSPLCSLCRSHLLYSMLTPQTRHCAPIIKKAAKGLCSSFGRRSDLCNCTPSQLK